MTPELLILARIRVNNIEEYDMLTTVFKTWAKEHRKPLPRWGSGSVFSTYRFLFDEQAPNPIDLFVYSESDGRFAFSHEIKDNDKTYEPAVTVAQYADLMGVFVPEVNDFRTDEIANLI